MSFKKMCVCVSVCMFVITHISESVGKVDRLVDAGCLHVCARRDTYGSVSG